jgi:hypothetical protein
VPPVYAHRQRPVQGPAAVELGRGRGADAGRRALSAPPRGRLSALSVFLSKSVFYGAFVWARRALNGPKRRFPARAVAAFYESLDLQAHLGPFLEVQRPSNSWKGEVWNCFFGFWFWKWQAFWKADVPLWQHPNDDQTDSREEIREAFYKFNDHETGAISFQELKRVAREFDRMPDEEELTGSRKCSIEGMICAADREGVNEDDFRDRTVNEDDFQRIMTMTSLF